MRSPLKTVTEGSKLKVARTLEILLATVSLSSFARADILPFGETKVTAKVVGNFQVETLNGIRNIFSGTGYINYQSKFWTKMRKMEIGIVGDEFVFETPFFGPDMINDDSVETEGTIGTTKVQITIKVTSSKKLSSKESEVIRKCTLGSSHFFGVEALLTEKSQVLHTYRIFLTSQANGSEKHRENNLVKPPINAQIILDTVPTLAEETKILKVKAPCTIVF